MRTLVSISLLILVPFSLTAQTKPLAPLVERAEVRLVNVDVNVVDSEGRPVSGLTPEDFEIQEDGKARPVAGFYAVEDSAVRLIKDERGMKVPAESDLRRKFILMIDNNTSQKIHRDAAIEHVQSFLDSPAAGEYEWSVVTIASEVETLQPFTADKEAVRSALLRARRKPSLAQKRVIDRDLLSDPGRGRLRQQHLDNKYDMGETARFQGEEQTKRNLLAMIDSANAVIKTVRAYSASAGKKAIVLITGGMELNTTFGAFDDEQDRNISDMKRAMEQVLQTMVREANSANFKIYIVKPAGHESAVEQHDVTNRNAGLAGTQKNPFFGEGYTSIGDRSDVDSSSFTLAMQTGGRYLPANSLRQSLMRIEEDTRTFYSLAFKPLASEDGKYHTISVAVKRPNVQVHHRSGYVGISPDQRLEMSLRSPLTFAKDKGDLPVVLEVGTPEKKEGDHPILPVTAATPFTSITLVSQGGSYVGRVHVYLSIYDDAGNNVGYHHRIQDVVVPAAEYEQSRSAPFRYPMKVGLKKGRFTVVVTVRDELSDQVGTGLKEVRL